MFTLGLEDSVLPGTEKTANLSFVLYCYNINDYGRSYTLMLFVFLYLPNE
jgi:hypothetical protein